VGREHAPHPENDPGSAGAVRDDTLLVITGLVPVISISEGAALIRSFVAASSTSSPALGR